MNHPSATTSRGRFRTIAMQCLVVAVVVVVGFVIGGAGLAIPIGAAAVAVFAASKTTRCSWPRKRNFPEDG